jgi:hypothetical protein
MIFGGGGQAGVDKTGVDVHPGTRKERYARLLSDTENLDIVDIYIRG